MKIQNRSTKQRVERGEKKNEKEKGRKKRSRREREKERKRKYFLNEKSERNLIIYIYIYIFLALSYSAQPYLAMHYSNEGKTLTFNSTATSLIFMCSGAKNSLLTF